MKPPVCIKQVPDLESRFKPTVMQFVPKLTAKLSQ